MVGVDLLAKLYKLQGNLDRINSDDDRAFVSSMVNLHQSGQRLNRHQILRIVDMPVPGEIEQDESQISAFWSSGIVRVIGARLEEVIWRYMPLEQLFAMIGRKTIHFSPLSTMEDMTEGQLPPRAWEETKRQLSASAHVGATGTDADIVMNCMVQQRRTDACINCWYMNTSDSLEMWRKYAPNNGVAIQSTVRRLASSLQQSQTPVTIVPVTYFAPGEEENYIDEAFRGSLFIKHDEFRPERELRALAFRVNLGNGADIPVDLELLIERLVLSPELRDWAVPVLTDTVRLLSFRGSVEKSSLKMF